MSGNSQTNLQSNGTGDPPRSAGKLYTYEMLALSAQLAAFPLAKPFENTAEARSKICGSTANIGIDCDERGFISGIGMQICACAVGQSSASILARHAIGREPGEIIAVQAGLADWLKDAGEIPDWPELDLLAGVKNHPGRHGALLLAWDAAARALCSEER